ncbi:glycosyltransferase [Teredinibacter sp. KSP-S5-2]|uniref:glycosyltransferase n=1 Tax=Teredinibacter sp. KSP-S5-2 TaxID=3034506 RepID=UPI00293423FF|nr:glycosyltransferase [Teredinibacter sp. KSP-S5-2]WNO11325.1 glycosyltransferase [Teredinibacter sp. KSP-S5-2]
MQKYMEYLKPGNVISENKDLDGVSIVIPTYNRNRLLDLSLLSLVNQIFPKDKYEVIVVDDGSNPKADVVVKKYESVIDLTYLYQDDQGFRVSKARNLGIKASKYKTILFIDCGVLCGPDVVSEHYALHKKRSIVAMGLPFCFETGKGIPPEIDKLLDLGELNIIFKLMGDDKAYIDPRYIFFQKYNFDLSNMKTPWIFAWTCHLSVSKSSLINVGGFDENFKSWGGEDVELAIRLYDNDNKFVVARDVKTFHIPHDKNKIGRLLSGRNNADYIHKKHNTKYTALLREGHGNEAMIRIIETGLLDKVR